MGATFFMLLMAILLCTGLFLAGINIILIIVWNIRKHRGKSPKKRYVVIPTVILVISIAITLIPVGFVCFLRAGNSTISSDIVMAESGEIIHWGHDENGGATISNFDWNGVKYVEIGYGSSNTWKLGDAIANIRYESDDSAFGKFWNKLFAYDDTSTLYPVSNDGGFDLYTIGSYMYCPVSEREALTAYYDDNSNYDLVHCTYEHVVFAEGNEEIDSLSKDIELTPALSKELLQLEKYLLQYAYLTGEDSYVEMEEDSNIDKNKMTDLSHLPVPVTLNVPEKYKKIAEERVPGTPFDGFEQGTITLYSKDGVMNKTIWIALLDDQVYCLMTITFGDDKKPDTITGYQLSSKLNESIKAIIY